MAQAHSDEAWRDWFQQHGPRLLLFARQQTRTDADAEDVLQEACVRVWKYGNHDVRLAYRTIRHAAIDLARSRQRRAAREESVVGDMITWFESPMAEAERAQTIQGVLVGLPAEQQEVVTLKIWGELTFAEIADVLGIPANTAASRYRLALDMLRRTLRPSMV
jgi:RNA polymerase sigma-70 factor (ECF subfamily)